ncbi:MAG TPA: hypothetical protein VL360_01750 [Gammaproteobacteria bacterium]|jgi:hypothetical protein|nr:hypothetical protein [Gammaproteobacteria bacterium]
MSNSRSNDRDQEMQDIQEMRNFHYYYSLKNESAGRNLGDVASLIVFYMKYLKSDEDRLYELQQWRYRLVDILSYPDLFSQIINTLKPEFRLKFIGNGRWFWKAPDGKEVRTEYGNRNLVTFALQQNLSDKVPELFGSVLAGAKIEEIIELLFGGRILWHGDSGSEEYTKAIINLLSIEQKKAYLEYRDKDNCNALHYVLSGAYLTPIADFIIKLYREVYGNKTAAIQALEQPNNKGETPLSLACGCDEALEFALSLYANKNEAYKAADAVDSRGNKLIHYAASYTYSQIIRILNLYPEDQRLNILCTPSSEDKNKYPLIKPLSNHFYFANGFDEVLKLLPHNQQALAFKSTGSVGLTVMEQEGERGDKSVYNYLNSLSDVKVSISYKKREDRDTRNDVAKSKSSVNGLFGKEKKRKTTENETMTVLPGARI